MTSKAIIKVNFHFIQRARNIFPFDDTLFFEGLDYTSYILRCKFCVFGDILDSWKIKKYILTYPKTLVVLNFINYKAFIKLASVIIMFPTHHASVQYTGVNNGFSIGDFIPFMEEKSIKYHNFVCLFGTKITIKSDMAKKIKIIFTRILCDINSILCDTKETKCDTKIA